MPFCPRCRLEYRAEFTTCPDCEEQLVAELSEPPSPEPEEHSYTEEWVPVAQFGAQVYATLIEEGFKSLGIPVTLLPGTGYFGQTGQMGTAFLPIEGAYIILVPREHVELADHEGEAMLGELWAASKPRKTT